MSASQSFLSDKRYGYDFVVATTQESINATIKQLVAKAAEPEVVVCYIADSAGNPAPIAFADLLQKSKGSDPFKIPASADPATNQDLKNLYEARFMVGFKARIGIPPGYRPAEVPDYVVLGADTSAVTYNLMCSEFIVTQFVPASGYSPAQWLNVSQPPGKAWIFTSKVDLRLQSGAFDQLSPDVQSKIKNLGSNAFSIQQLLFDLDNAGLQSIPTMSGVDPASNAYMVLTKDFLGKYFTAVKTAGQPVLGCIVRQVAPDPSTLALTDFNFETLPLLDPNSGKPFSNPTPDQSNAGMLAYVCAADHDPLPSPVAFSWNWLDPAEDATADGVIAINRDTLATYFKNYQSLTRYVASNCYHTHVRVWMGGFADATTHYSWDLTANQPPKVESVQSGPVVLTFSFDSGEAQDDAGLNGDMGELKLRSFFDLSISFLDDTIVIAQHLVVWVYLRSLQTSVSGNLVDKSLTDTYALSVDATGRLVTAMTTTSDDKSEDPSTNGFLDLFTGVNDLIDKIKDSVQNFTSPRIQDIPVAIIQDFVFPGGRTFVFKDGRFSANQDLVSHIQYADPTA